MLNSLSEFNVPLVIFTVRQPQWVKQPHSWGSAITPRHTAFGRTPLDGWSARRRELYLITHNTHKRQISSIPCQIRTRNPSKLGPAEPSFRPHDHWARPSVFLMNLIQTKSSFKSVQVIWPPAKRNREMVWNVRTRLKMCTQQKV